MLLDSVLIRFMKKLAQAYHFKILHFMEVAFS